MFKPTAYLLQNNLLHLKQNGFKAGHETETPYLSHRGNTKFLLSVLGKGRHYCLAFKPAATVWVVITHYYHKTRAELAHIFLNINYGPIFWGQRCVYPVLDQILVCTEKLHFRHVQCTVTKVLCKPCFSRAVQFSNTPSITPYDSWDLSSGSPVFSHESHNAVNRHFCCVLSIKNTNVSEKWALFKYTKTNLHQ